MTRAYTYGLLPPTRGAGLVAEQMRRGHAYYGVLVEIERARRAAVREILERGGDLAAQARLAELVADRDRAREEIRRVRAAARRRAETPDQRAIVRELDRSIATLRAELRQQRARLRESAQVGIAWAQLMAYQAVRDARAASGLYWGTYLLHERAVRAAATANAPPEPPPPWRGEGRVSVQLQGGVALDELASDTQLQILPGRPIEVGRDPGALAAAESVPGAVTTRADPRYGMPLGGNGRARGLGTRRARVLRLRVGSGGRAPVWAEWPMQLHRPLPSGARVKMATVSLRRRGTRSEWSVQIVVDDDACARPAAPAPASGAVALNLGYARRPDGQIRAGYLVGSDGWQREVLVEASVVSAIDKASAIRSQRDLDFDRARAELGTWIASQDPASLPAWFCERTQHLASWRSLGRLASLAWTWQRGWWDDGAAGYDLVERWRLRDLHLERYETGLRSAALRRRRDAYRVLAREVADRYQILVVDDTDLRALQEAPRPESDDAPTWPAARHQRVVASPHELRAALTDAFGADRTDRLPAAYVTRDHESCGYRNEPCRDTRELACAGCGIVYDQDANACRNLLRAHAREAQGDEVASMAALARRGRGYRIRKRSADRPMPGGEEDRIAQE